LKPTAEARKSCLRLLIEDAKTDWSLTNKRDQKPDNFQELQDLRRELESVRETPENGN
jgi:hypothetical protein